MTLRILPDTIVNRIAAGEVIERPSSAVKELVENSIDAGASNVSVQIENGGRNLIVISDDGIGMSAKELELAIERHATSKLDDEDLFNINSFGFRGEALPSIASVSRMTISSRAKDSEEAWSLRIEGGTKHPLEPSSQKNGTKIEVKDLFFATPARLKFLKTERTEQQYIVSIINQIAMSNPEISFSLTSNGKTIIDLKSTDDWLKRIGDILGKDFTENALKINTEREGIGLQGFASLPTYNRGTSSAQYLFVNGRPIKDKLVIGAIRGAYQDFLARDRHPVVVLFLDVPPELVDVNVHPAKAEVRFRDSGVVRGLIVSSLRNALSAAGHKASTTVSQTALGAFNNPVSSQGNFPAGHSPSYPQFREPYMPSYRAASESLAAQQPLDVYTQPEARAAEIVHEETNFENAPLGAARCQLHKTYIVSQTADGLVIVDQHAAHERLVYEKMKENIRNEGIKTQKLLIPEVVELEPASVERILAKRDEFSELGFVFEKLSETSIMAKETPALLGEVDVKALVRDLADELEEFGEGLTLKEKLEEVCGTIACHGSVRSGRILNTHEMNAMLREMEATPHSGQCNHGRPTYVELKLHEIEKLFGRK